MTKIRSYFSISFVLLGALPLFILAMVNITSAYFNAQDNAKQSLMLQAKEKAQNIEALLESKRSQLSEFAENSQLLALLSANTAESVGSFEDNPDLKYQIQNFVVDNDVHDLLLINRSGEIIYTALQGKEIGSNVGDPEFAGSAMLKGVKTAMRLLDPEVTPFEAYKPTGEYSSFVIVPVMTNNQRLGVLALRLSHQGIEAIVQRFYGYVSGEVELARRIDSKQAIAVAGLSGSDFKAFEYKFDLTHHQSLMNEALSGTSDIGSGIDYQGKKVYAAWRYIPSMELGIVAKASIIEAQADTLNLAKIAFLLLALFLAIIVVVGRHLGHQISLPIAILAEGAKKVEQGEYGHRVNVDANNELGTLARSFNSLIEWMEAATVESQQHANTQKLHIQLADLSTRHSTTQSQSKAILQFFIQQLGCQVGAFYSCRQQTDRWELFACAGIQRRLLQQHVELDDGVLGEAIIEKTPRIISFGDEEARHSIATGTQTVPAKQVLIYPVVYQSRVVHLLEFASSSGFSRIDIELLDSFAERIALTILTTANNEGVAELLAETQAQSEELQVQQDELKEINESLEAQGRDLQIQSQKLLEQKKEIEQKAEQLDVSGRYKSQFLANMSHELRTPLNSMLILSKSLADNEEGLLCDDDVQAASVIHQSGNSLLLLINDILDLSKIESGKMEIHIAAFHTQELETWLVAHFKHMAEEKNLDYSVSVSQDVDPVLVQDQHRILQVATNLIGNAIKFTDSGQVRVELAQHQGQLSLSVQDTGCGIEQTQLESVFDAFTQVDGSVQRRHNGTGLGLTICKQIAELLGGEVLVKSQINQGSTFTLCVPLGEMTEAFELQEEPSRYLPSTIEAPLKMEAPAEMECKPSNQDALWDDVTGSDIQFIVVSEDEQFASHLAQRCLKRGFLVSGMPDIQQAMQWVSEKPVDAVIVDNLLRREIAREIAYSLKAASVNPRLQIHFLSGDEMSHHSDYLDDISMQFDGSTGDQNRAKPTVLAVEDNAGAFAATKRLLKGQAIQLRHVPNAELAIEEIASGGIDLLLLDLGLPGMSGFELLENALRRKLRLPKIMIHTGRDLSCDELETLDQYADQVIIKSQVSMQRLLEEMELFVDSFQNEKPISNSTGVAPLTSIPTLLPESIGHVTPQDRDTIEARLQGKQLLLVDDDVRNTFSLAKVLRAKGMIAHICSNGADALEHIQNNPAIDLVVLDIMMPVMDGYEVLRRVRTVMKNSELPIIALTASGVPDVREKCLHAGASNYVMKPITDMDAFIGMLSQYVNEQ
jgi:signal transduction histidine kinase/DNA-binding response OmpR family regulator/HAMP domain-containing protein